MYGKLYRGFESHPLRHKIFDFRLPIAKLLRENRFLIGSRKSAIGNLIRLRTPCNREAANPARPGTEQR